MSRKFTRNSCEFDALLNCSPYSALWTEEYLELLYGFAAFSLLDTNSISFSTNQFGRTTEPTGLGLRIHASLCINRIKCLSNIEESGTRFDARKYGMLLD